MKGIINFLFLYHIHYYCGTFIWQPDYIFIIYYRPKIYILQFLKYHYMTNKITITCFTNKMKFNLNFKLLLKIMFETRHKGTEYGCKHDRLWVRIPLEEIFFALVQRQKMLLSSTTQYARPTISKGKLGRRFLTLSSVCLSYCVRDTA